MSHYFLIINMFFTADVRRSDKFSEKILQQSVMKLQQPKTISLLETSETFTAAKDKALDNILLSLQQYFTIYTKLNCCQSTNKLSQTTKVPVKSHRTVEQLPEKSVISSNSPPPPPSGIFHGEKQFTEHNKGL